MSAPTKSVRWLSRFASLVWFLAVAACSNSPPTRSTQSPPAETVGIASPGFQALAGSVHPLAQPKYDVGRMAPTSKLTGMSLLFRQSGRQQALGRVVLSELQDPASPRYHRWLTPADYAASFGVGAAELARATAWLEGEGFTVHGPTASGARLLFTGTVGQVEQAFHTEMHQYSVNGAAHFALAVPPSVPTPLAASVLGLR